MNKNREFRFKYVASQLKKYVYEKIQQSWQTSALAVHLPLARLVSMCVIFAYFQVPE